MGAVVITACRPSGISGLILVPNSPCPGLSHVSGPVSSWGENSAWKNTFKTTEICMGAPRKPTKVCGLCWLSGWLGCIEFHHSATAHTRCAPLWSSPPTEGGKRCVTGLTVTAKNSNRDNQECNSIVTKYLRTLFSPPALPLSLSPSLSSLSSLFLSRFLSVFQPLWCVSMRTARQSR